MYRMVMEYDDEVCCDKAEKVIEDEVCDTYGGDYTFRDVYTCNTCKRAFVDYSGGRFNGIEEIEFQENRYNY